MISKVKSFFRPRDDEQPEMREIFSNSDPTYIDVREPSEFLMGHVDGAINIPLGSISEKLDEIRKLPLPIVLYCRSGIRSAQALGLLKAYGIKNAHNGGGLAEVIVYQKKYSNT